MIHVNPYEFDLTLEGLRESLADAREGAGDPDGPTLRRVAVFWKDRAERMRLRGAKDPARLQRRFDLVREAREFLGLDTVRVDEPATETTLT